MDRQTQAIKPEHVALTECDMQGSQAVARRDQSLWSHPHSDCECYVEARASRRKITKKGASITGKSREHCLKALSRPRVCISQIQSDEPRSNDVRVRNGLVDSGAAEGG